MVQKESTAPSRRAEFPPATDEPEGESQVLRVAQPQCQAVFYLREDVVLACSQPAGHATMPGHPPTHSITLQWNGEAARLDKQAPG